MKYFKSTVDYYNDRAKIYDETAGYKNIYSEKIREKIKNRFQELLKNYDVIEIACGTGYWTKVISAVAKHVTATDINDEMIKLARKNCINYNNIEIIKSDALKLNNLNRKFNAAFHHFWWAHIPKSRINIFLQKLHNLLENDSLVVMADNSFGDTNNCFFDNDNNRVEIRELHNGRYYNVIKNIYSKDELCKLLGNYAENIDYKIYNDNKFWIISYKLNKGNKINKN